MNAQEAIKAIKDNKPTSGYTTLCEALDMAIEALEKQSKLECVIKRLEDNSFWTEATFDEDGYCNDDSEKVIGLYVAIEIIRQELM